MSVLKKLSFIFVGLIFFTITSQAQIALMEEVADTAQTVVSKRNSHDFRGVWEVETEGTVFGFQIIWKDENGKYQTLYMDSENDVTTTLDIYEEGGKLIIKSYFEPNDWTVTKKLTIVNTDTIEVDGMNNDGPFTSTMIRMRTGIATDVDLDGWSPEEEIWIEDAEE